MIEVQGPDGSTFEFPDEMPHGDIEAALRSHYGPPSFALQGPPNKTAINEKGERLGLTNGLWLPQVPEGFVVEDPPLPKGYKLEATPSHAFFAKSATNAKGERLGLFGGQWTPPPPDGFIPEEPPLPQGFRLEETPAMDVLKSARSGVANGVASIPGAAGDAQAALQSHNPFDWLQRKLESTFPDTMARLEASSAQSKTHHSELGPIGLPTTEEVKAKTGLDAADYEPQTRAGRWAKTGGEFLPGAVAGPVSGVRELAANILRLGIVPGLASEVAGEATKGTKLEPWARTAAALVAPAAAARAVSLFPFRGPEASAAAHADAVATLRREGVHVSAGQEADNSRLKFLENDLNPEAGKETLEGFTRAATRAGGAETPVLIHGRGGTVDNLLDEVSSRFDRLQAANTLHADAPLVQDLYDLRNEYTRVPGAYEPKVVNALNGAIDHIADNLRAGGLTLTGEQYQRLRSNLNSAARSAEGPHSEALHSVVAALDDAAERSISRTNPADAGEFGRARGDYKRALVSEKAATAAGESPARGYITPAQLASAAKAIYGKRAYERGQSPFSDLGQAGAAVLKAMPDSGTSQRLRIDQAISAITGAGAGALGFHFGGSAHIADSAIGGLLLGERLGHFADAPVRAVMRAALLNEPVQRYLGNQVAAGAPRLRDTPQGLLTAAEAARQ